MPPNEMVKTGGVGGSMKKQLADFDATLQSQSDQQSSQGRQINELENVIGPSGSNLTNFVESKISPIQEKLMSIISEMQEEMDHKFSLQVAENKRMQQHLSTAKRENQAMAKRVVALEERVATLELELGGDE